MTQSVSRLMATTLCLLLLLVGGTLPTFAFDGTPVDSSLTAIPDTLRSAPADSLRAASANSLYREAFKAGEVDDTIPAPWDDQMLGEELNYVNDSMPRLVADYDSVAAELEWYEEPTFNPVPAKAVWYAALFPGGGQIYNRKYWKLPIIYGGFLGLLYGYQWNNRYYKTYSNAYRDLVLDSPNASFKDFLPPNYDVSGRHDYLERVFKRKKNNYRNYRDYCVVGMLGVYLVAMVDAYVDASLYHFDVSPDLGMNNEPVLRVSYTYNF